MDASRSKYTGCGATPGLERRKAWGSPPGPGSPLRRFRAKQGSSAPGWSRRSVHVHVISQPCCSCLSSRVPAGRERKASRPHPPARALRTESNQIKITDGTFAGAHERDADLRRPARRAWRALFAAACSLGAHGGFRLLLDIVHDQSLNAVALWALSLRPSVCWKRGRSSARALGGASHRLLSDPSHLRCPRASGLCQTVGPSNTLVHVPPNPSLLTKQPRFTASTL